MVAGSAPDRDEEGFTLVEVVVALGLAVTLFTAAGAALGQMALTVRFARQNQQAIDLASREIEQIRALDYGAVAMVAGDLADPDITTPDGVPGVDPDRGGPAASERLVVAEGGAVVPHLRTVEVNGTAYTVARYITDPGDPEGRYRRALVRVRWQRAGTVHERQAGTFVTLTRRGLPLPNFSFAAPVTVTVNAGATLVLSATVTNRGARDAWELAAAPSGRSWKFTWYRDVDDNGVWDAALDAPALADSNADGRPETPSVDPDRAMRLFAVAELPTGEPAGTVDTVLAAQSKAQPDAPTATAEIHDTVQVVNQTCSNCTYYVYYLRNSSVPGDTTAQSAMPVDDLAPTQPALPNFDIDHDVVAGRTVLRGGSNTTSDLALMANWRYQAPTRLRLSGTAKITLFAANAVDVAAPVTLTVHVNVQRTGAGFEAVGSTTVTVPAGDAFRVVEASVPVDVEVPRNRRIEVRVVVPATSADDVVFAYDTASYPAAVQLPFASGA